MKTKLAEVASSRDNNLDIIRFVAAIAVIFSHSYTITLGIDASGHLSNWTDGRLSTGGVAVGVFFLFGGFLIAKSCESHRSAKRYFALRSFRIFPQLIFVVALMALVIGPLLSNRSIPEYYSDPKTYRYLLNGILVMQHNLPGVFENNPYPNDINGALWTLPVEFACYVLCYLGFKLTSFDKKKFALCSIPCIALIGVYFAVFNLFQLSVVRAIVLFYIGVAFYVYRNAIALTTKAGFAALVLFVALIALKLDVPAMLLAFPYAFFWLGYGTKKKFSGFARRGEYSYGIYLWGWPVQQMLCLFWAHPMLPIVNAVLASLIAVGLGVANYRLVDVPVKKLQRKVMAMRRMQ
ncbi:acyltransferase family protein [Raoultibacter phocaeensis]|uniref:acyltransferase family protein n=1 Tax=Raoultibacter phocaeensis TaxID=2479841 RepID=UPI001117C7C7|nr:acyltransferase [Raoultibacter phocaeensis]